MYQELNNLIDYLKGTKILIAGFGREGKSTLRFLLKHVPDVSVSVGMKMYLISMMNLQDWIFP